MTTQVDEARRRARLAEQRYYAARWMRDNNVDRVDGLPHEHALRDTAMLWAEEQEYYGEHADARP
jgi:hypothetical protein